MNGVQTRFKCKLDVKRCKRFVFPPSSLLPRSNALKTKAIRYFQTDRTLTRIVSPPLPKKSHKWVILDIDNKLVFYEKNKMPGNYENDYGELFLNYLPFQSLPYKLLWLTEGDITLNRYEWKDEVEILVNPEDEYYSSFFLNKWNREMVEKLYPRRSALTEMKKMIQALFYILKNKFKSRFSNHRNPVTLSEYIKTHEVVR